ncbi:hypothetical protein V5O48_014995 [Marasmius crinis-equi]|uniref:Secreted protein n=1 Tax=Marasmius crinis-equi TaxID=585013 RepID=A0ABR3EVQ3_9AGAR
MSTRMRLAGSPVCSHRAARCSSGIFIRVHVDETKEARMILHLSTIVALFVSHAYSQSDHGSFVSPKTGPKFRYWIEDSSADLDILRKDVAEMAKVGFSGFEPLSYQSYGGFDTSNGEVIIDPSEVAFGSDAFATVTKTLIQAAKANGITMDFTLGPNQSAGVPVQPDQVDQEGMLTELVFGSRFLQPGDSFDGPLPDPIIVPFRGTNDVIWSANVTGKTLLAVLGAQLAEGADPAASRVSLDYNTLVDLTDEIQTSGNSSTLLWSPNANTTTVLLAYYYRRAGFPEARGGFNGAIDDKPGSWGSYVVDHLSAKGVNISTSFIESNVLSRDGIGELLAEPGVGKYMWEDSLEFISQALWTPHLPQRFQERHGYSINKILPVIHALVPGGPSFSNGSSNPNQTFDYGTTTNAWAFTEDYRDTLTTLYADYIQAFNEWAESIGLQYSNQPGYGFQFDLSALAALPAVPEIESLALSEVDDTRQLTAGVHLGNRSILSSETGARYGSAAANTMAQLLEDCKFQFAGHVNLIMIHGYVYSGPYPQTTWPGIYTFPWVFSEMHGPHNPAWDHYSGYMKFIARNQYILQSGIPKVDIALYRKGYDYTKGGPPTPFPAQQSPFPSDSLVDAGYTYEYISPENFKLPGVSVTGGRLAAGGPAYKAIVLNRVRNITVDAAQNLIDYANDGLPIVIAGGLPDGIPGFDADGTQVAKVQGLVQQLAVLPTVKQVDGEDDVPGALLSFNVTPAAKIEPSSSTLYTIRRDVESAGGMTSHFYLWNQGNITVDFALTLAATGTPFVLDPWSGEVNPVGVWNVTEDGHTVIPGVSLAAKQSALFTVTTEDGFEGVSASPIHISSADSDVSGFITSSGMETQTVSLSLEGEPVRELTSWQLNITAWTPPADLTQVDSVLVPHPPNTSGVGAYVTTFEWAHEVNSSVGLQLDLGSVVHTLKAWLNGVELHTADPTRPVVDISNIVKEGTNTIRVDVASTLLNAILGTPGVQSLGRFMTGTPLQPPAHYGLVSPVRLIPYARTMVEF